MKRRVYPEHTPTRLESLDGVPKHWSIRKLKHVASVQFSSVDKNTAEGEQPVRLCNYIDVYHNEYISPELEFMEATASPNEIEAFGLKKGEVLVTKDSESWDDIAVPAYVRSDLRGVICGYHLAQVHPDPERVDGEYLFRAFRACAINHQFRIAATGITRYGLGKYWLDNALFPVPPLKEQRVIASFLDRETGKIDVLVEKKKRLIELLQEKRIAIISQAVTKGLEPAVPMKDSGIGWLGKIPEHWEVVRLGRKVLLQRGVDITKDQQNVGNVPVISSGGLSSFHDQALAVGPGVVIGRKGTAGAVYYIEQDFWPHDTTLWVREFRDNCPRYVFYKLSVMDLPSFDTGSANPTLNRNLIHPVTVSWPPAVTEQRIIADFLDRETSKIDGLIAKIREGIEKLKEYRTALISAAVTGKIDVRAEFPGNDHANASADVT